MSRVQGTTVQLAITFDTDPPDVQVTVQPPTAAQIVAKHSTGGVTKSAPKVYAYLLDTSAEPGRWEYEVASLGAVANIRQRRSIDVRDKLGP
jgi:hypothetical protein